MDPSTQAVHDWGPNSGGGADTYTPHKPPFGPSRGEGRGRGGGSWFLFPPKKRSVVVVGEMRLLGAGGHLDVDDSAEPGGARSKMETFEELRRGRGETEGSDPGSKHSISCRIHQARRE